MTSFRYLREFGCINWRWGDIGRVGRHIGSLKDGSVLH